MRRIFLAAATTLFLIISAFASSDPEILIESQPDSPLLLSDVTQRWRESTTPRGEKIDMLSVSIKINNVSQKAIRSYGICYHDGSFEISQPRPTSLNAVLQPAEQKVSEGIESSFDRQNDKPAKIKVDFVEFMDGTTWGADSMNFREFLVGFRAGAKAGLQFLQNKNRENGVDAVITSLEETKNLPPPENQNNTWLRGFRYGLGSIKNQVSEISKKEGSKGIETQLPKLQFFSN